jgi:hypothetical protein
VTFLQYHNGTYFIANFGVWLWNHSGFDNARMLLERVLHFGRSNKDSTALEAIITTASYVETSFLVRVGNIPSAIPTATKRALSSVRIIVITNEKSRIFGRNR